MNLRLAALALMTTALPALAQEVNIYSHRQPELIQPLLDAFTAETGIKTNVAFVDKGMAERLTARARIVYASKERVKDGEVTTYEDLTDPKWKGRICTRSGTNDYNIALLSAVIAHDGLDAAKTWAEGLKANLARKPDGGDRDQVKAIWAGECDISLGNTYYMGQMVNDDEQKAWADSVRIVFPTFAAGGTHLNVSGVAMTKSAPNKDAALKLMEWLSSDAAQKIYAETNHEFPVKPGVATSDLVASWGSFTPDSLPLTDVAGHRADALKIMEEINFDG